MKIPRLLAACFVALPCFASAASYSFDGYIERTDPEDWGGFVSIDRLELQVASSGTLTLDGQETTLQGLSFGLYSSHLTEDGLVLDFVTLEFSTLPNGATRQQGFVAAGSYYVVLNARISEWEGGDGLDDYARADGGPGLGYGGYHLDIVGDFSVTNVHEGALPYAPVPEPAGYAVALGLPVLGFAFHRRRPRQ